MVATHSSEQAVRSSSQTSPKCMSFEKAVDDWRLEVKHIRPLLTKITFRRNCFRQDGASHLYTAFVVASFLAQNPNDDLKATSSPTEQTNTASQGSQPAPNKTAARDITCKISIQEDRGASCPSQINPNDSFIDCEKEILHQEASASPVEKSFQEEACASCLSLISTLLSCGTGDCNPLSRLCESAGVPRRAPSLAFLIGVKSLSLDRLLFCRW